MLINLFASYLNASDWDEKSIRLKNIFLIIQGICLEKKLFHIFLWFQSRGRTGVCVSERGRLFWDQCFLFVCLHFAIKKIDVNLIQKLCYMERGIPWREYSILRTTYPLNLFAVHVLWGLRWKNEAAMAGCQNHGNLEDLLPSSPLHCMAESSLLTSLPKLGAM